MHPRLLPQPLVGRLDVPERRPGMRGAAGHLPRPHMPRRGAAVRDRLLELIAGLVEESSRGLEIVARSHRRLTLRQASGHAGRRKDVR